jgi:hypothetical protein
VRFVIVNVREAHPGSAFPQPATLAAKMNHAERLRDLYGFAADGTILFRAHWANDTAALSATLDAVVTKSLLRRTQSGGIFKPMLRMLRYIAPVLDRAGSGAWADMWRVAPPAGGHGVYAENTAPAYLIALGRALVR